MLVILVQYFPVAGKQPFVQPNRVSVIKENVFEERTVVLSACSELLHPITLITFVQ
jgi:hypothetical protein